MSTQAEMMQDKFSSIFEHMHDISFTGSDIWITFHYQEVKDVLPECGDLFNQVNNYDIDNLEHIPPFDNLPEEGEKIKILTSSEILRRYNIFTSRNPDSATKKYFNIVALDSRIPDYTGWLFLIGRNLSPERPETFSDVDTCFAVYEKLKQLADHTFPGSIAFLCSKTILEVPSRFTTPCVSKLEHTEDFLHVDLTSSRPECSIFKSVLYENLSRVDKDQRLEKFFSIFDTIMQEFKISRSIHYDRYNLNILKKELDESFITINEKIRNSVENVKGELILIVSMAFVLTQFDYDWVKGTIENIIILASLVVASIIYTYLMRYDKETLSDLEKIVDEEKARLDEIIVEEVHENEKTKMISADAARLKKNIDSHTKFLKFCLVVIWLPLLISLVLMIIHICPGSTPTP